MYGNAGMQPMAGGAPWGGMPGQQQANVGQKGQLPNALNLQYQMYGGAPNTQAADIGVTGQLPSAGGLNGLTPINYNQGMNQDMNTNRAGMGGNLKGGLGGQGVSFEAGNFGDMLRVMNAERMQLENELREAEDVVMKDFAERKEAERQDKMKKLAGKLAEQLSGCVSPLEIQAIMDQHNIELERAENELSRSKEQEQEDLMQQLKDKREQKLNALRWKHEQMALENNLKLAEVDLQPNTSAQLNAQQALLDLTMLEASRELAEGESNMAVGDTKAYGNQMSDNFSKQMDMLVDNGALYADQAQELMNRELELNEKLEREMELKKAEQMVSFNEKLAKRKADRLKKLKEKQELEKAQAIRDGKDLTELQKKHDRERELVDAMFDAEEAEQKAEISKKLEEEHKDAIRHAHRDLLDKMIGDHNINDSLAQEMIDQLRKDNDSVVESLERKRAKNYMDLQAKLEARKNRRQQEAKRQGGEEAAQRILDEHSRLALQSKPTGVEYINIPNVVAGQSPEEQAIKREQERSLEALKERHVEDQDKLEEKLEREAREAEKKALDEFETYRQRALREAKNRQAAELTARSGLSSDETQQLLAAHQVQLENLMESLEGDRSKQNNNLKQKLAEKRKQRAEALKKKQGNQLAKELLEQTKELADAERNALKDAEKEAMLEAIRENGAEATEYIVKKILEQRHAKEVADLDRMFAEEKRITIDDTLAKLDEEHFDEKEKLKFKHDREYQALAEEGLSPEDLQQKRAQLFNQQQLEMNALEKKQAEEKKTIQKNAVGDWELRFAKAKLELKEKHYKEFADYLNELSPELASDNNSSVSQAQQAAKELAKVREKLDEQKKENEEKLKKEMEDFEAAEKERMQSELEEHERLLEKEAEDERKKNEKSILALNARKEALLREKKVKAKQEISKLLKQGGSKQDQEALLKEHSKDLAKLMSKMDADRLRMQDQLEARLKKKRSDRKQSKVKELNDQAKEAKDEFKEKLDNDEEEMNNNAKIILNETINVDDLVKASVPEPTVNKQIDDSSSQMPLSYEMTAPLSDNDLNKLLMQSPLYQKLQDIKDQLNGDTPKNKENKKEGESYIDERDDTLFSSDEKLQPIDLNAINSREFVIYKFSCFIKDLLIVHCHHKPIDILLADKLPPNANLTDNAYRNSFYYDPTNCILYLRRDRLENVGEFILVLVHTLSHIKTEDMRNDSDPKFVKEFYKALSTVCSDLFLSRYKKSNALNEAVLNLPPGQSTEIADVGMKVLGTVFGDSHEEIERSNVVNDLLDTKLIRNKKDDSDNFNQEVMFQRLGKYADFIATNKLSNFLGDVEKKLKNVKKQGSKTEVDKRLDDLQLKVKDERPMTSYLPKKNRDIARDVARQNARNIALARSPLALSFIPPRTAATRQEARRESPDGEDFYEVFLKSQIDELQEKIDDIDIEFVNLTRQSLDLSGQVKQLENETAIQIDTVRNTSTNSRDYEKLTDIVKSLNSKLSATRSQLTNVTLAKADRVKRLNAYKKELNERKLLLEEHQLKTPSEKTERSDRKLKSSLAKTR